MSSYVLQRQEESLVFHLDESYPGMSMRELERYSHYELEEEEQDEAGGGAGGT